MSQGDDPTIGEQLADGRIYAGRSPKTDEMMFIDRDGLVKAGDRDNVSFEEAQAAMKNLAPFGWRAPSVREATQFSARKAGQNPESIASFWNVTASDNAGQAPKKTYEGKAVLTRERPKPGGMS